MSETVFSAAELAQIQDELASTATTLAAIPSVGGTVWNRSTTSASDGIHTKPTETAAGTVVGNVYGQLPPAIAQSLAGTPVPVAMWYFVGDDANTLLAGDKIASATSPDLVFAVNSVNQQPGYIIAGLQRANGRRL